MSTTSQELVWKALSDPTRREILDLLRCGAKTTGDLSDRFPVTRYAVMKHLKVLHEAGLVLIRREGRQRFNYLNAIPIREIYERWVSRYEGQWAQSITSLRRLAEQTQGEGTMSTDTKTYSISKFEQETVIDAPRERVFEALTQEVNSWWSLRGGETRKMHLETFPGGRLYEVDEKGGGFLWGTVMDIRPPEALHVAETYASVCPGVNGSFKVTLTEADGKTTLKLSYHCSGDLAPNMEECNAQGWNGLFGVCLKRLVENGEVCKVVLI